MWAMSVSQLHVSNCTGIINILHEHLFSGSESASKTGIITGKNCPIETTSARFRGTDMFVHARFRGKT